MPWGGFVALSGEKTGRSASTPDEAAAPGGTLRRGLGPQEADHIVDLFEDRVGDGPGALGAVAQDRVD